MDKRQNENPLELKNDFKYNEELLQILMCFVESSIEHDMRGAILGNINTQSGGEKLTKTISKYIKDSSHQWVEKGKRVKCQFNVTVRSIVSSVKNRNRFVDSI